MPTALSILKQIGGYTAVLYAFGFLAVHGRMNALGVWSQLPMVDVQYLIEGALFLVATLLNVLFPYGFILLIVAALAICILRWVPETKVAHLRSILFESIFLQVAVLLVLTFLTFNQAGLLLGTSGLLVTNMTQQPGHSWIQASTGMRANIYGALSLLTITAITFAIWIRFKSRAPIIFHVGAGAVAVLLSILLPFNYAVLQRISEFPFATVILDNPPEQRQGALLLRGADQIVIHVAKVGVIALPADRVKELQIVRYVTLESLRSE